MPNGYRRGGEYTRNGRTFTRRGTAIASPKTAALVGLGALVGIGLLTGGAPLLVHPGLLLGLGVLAGGVWLGWKPMKRKWRARQLANERRDRQRLRLDVQRRTEAQRRAESKRRHSQSERAASFKQRQAPENRGAWRVVEAAGSAATVAAKVAPVSPPVKVGLTLAGATATAAARSSRWQDRTPAEQARTRRTVSETGGVVQDDGVKLLADQPGGWRAGDVVCFDHGTRTVGSCGRCKSAARRRQGQGQLI